VKGDDDGAVAEERGIEPRREQRLTEQILDGSLHRGPGELQSAREMPSAASRMSR
jgi:hypothetical protein